MAAGDYFVRMHVLAQLAPSRPPGAADEATYQARQDETASDWGRRALAGPNLKACDSRLHFGRYGGIVKNDSFIPNFLVAEFCRRRRVWHTEVLLSMPGFGPVLAAEFLGDTGGDLTVFQSVNRFAGVVGLAPAPRDSGKISGNHHRPRRYDRRLLRVFYLSGLSALKSCPTSRGY